MIYEQPQEGKRLTGLRYHFTELFYERPWCLDTISCTLKVVKMILIMTFSSCGENVFVCTVQMLRCKQLDHHLQ